MYKRTPDTPAERPDFQFRRTIDEIVPDGWAPQAYSNGNRIEIDITSAASFCCWRFRYIDQPAADWQQS
ncbi:MAG: hypothetical protein QOD93_2059 [Acetobacteraceae bacterium]|nr:hypothetical protein [Acetobacteraceae bacterium]